DCRHRSVSTLVARFRPGPLDRLLDGIRRQYAEGNRYAGLVRDAREPARAFSRDIIEVRRRTFDDGSYRNDRVVAPALRKLARDDRQIERTGCTHDFDLFLARAMATQRIDRAAHELLDDEFVEPRREDRETELAALQVAFDDFDIHRCGHGAWGSGLGSDAPSIAAIARQLPFDASGSTSRGAGPSPRPR